MSETPKSNGDAMTILEALFEADPDCESLFPFDSGIDISKALNEAKAKDDHKKSEASNIVTEITRGGEAMEISGMDANELAKEFYTRHVNIDKSKSVADSIFSIRSGSYEKWFRMLKYLQNSGAFFDLDNASQDMMQKKVHSDRWVHAHTSGNIDGKLTGWVAGATAMLPKTNQKKPITPVPDPENPNSVFHNIKDEERARAIAKEIRERPFVACLGDELGVFPEEYRRHHLGIECLKSLIEYIDNEVNGRIKNEQDRIKWMLGWTFRLEGLVVPRLKKMIRPKKPEDCMPVLNIPSLLLQDRSKIGGILCWKIKGPHKKGIIINTAQYDEEGSEEEEVELRFGWDCSAIPIKKN